MWTTLRRPKMMAVLAALALGAVPSVGWASHSWGSYHWARTANPFTLKLGDNLSSTWDPYLADPSTGVSYYWSISSVLDTTVVPGKTTGRKCRPTLGRVEVCNATYGNNGWLGLAQIWVNGSHISQGTAKMNDSYFNSPTYNTVAWRRMVMCQEVAHTFGLDHQDENFDNSNLGTCMDYTSNPAGPPSNEYPNAHDYEQLETIYAHLDSSTTVFQSTASGRMPPAMADIDLAGPGQWGKLIRSSHDGGTQLYVADFGGGRKVFTFVIWADRSAAEQP